MATPRKGKAIHRTRKATFVAFCLVALSNVAAQAVAPASIESRKHSSEGAPSVERVHEEISEASNAYNEAMHTLHALHPPPKHATAPNSQITPSFIRSLFPNTRGPISMLLRMTNIVRNHRWIPRWLSGKMDRIQNDDSGSSWNIFRGYGGADSTGRSAIKIIDLLEHAADLGHLDAMYTLAGLSLFPPIWSSLPINATRAFNYYSTHADHTGNATSQYYVAFFYATGYAPDGAAPPVQVDQARALLYYTFSAHGGHSGASMVLGYRNWAGIGVHENCMAALEWYKAAAEAAMKLFQSGPPGGRTLPKTATRISDLDGGVFGPGASVASTGLNVYRPVIKTAKSRGTGETWDDLLEFYKFHAERDEVEYAFRLGRIYYQGSIYHAPGGVASGAEGFGSVPQDLARAKQYFLSVARHVWPAQPISGMNKKAHLTKHEGVDEPTVVMATWAAAYLGRMYLRGEGVRKDIKVARIWFERGAEYNEKECLNGLGIIWRDGLLEKSDEKLAHEYFSTAASQDLAEAQINLGKYHYERAEYGFANKYFEAAIRHGSPFEAFYYIAAIHARRAQDPTSSLSLSAGSCGVAVSFFKLVAERGSWQPDTIGEAERLWLGLENNGNSFANGLISPPSTGGGGGDDRVREREGAKLRWRIAAEQGFEIAQNNLAYVLDQHKSLLPNPMSPGQNNQTARQALVQWTRSAAQHDVDALVKVGDYYYHGVGVDDESQELLWEKAAGYYLSAVETQRSALAMWNLGWMYESGRGVNMDYHLAKRYYDMALDTNTEAYLPVMLSLCKLYAKSLWHTLSGGSNKSLLLLGSDGTEDEHWYLGKAREEFAKRWRGRKGAPSPKSAHDAANSASDNPPTIDSDDPVQWAEDQKAAEIERTRAEEEAYERGDFFSGDFLATGDPRRHQRFDENGHEIPDKEEFWETMLLVALVVMISCLIFVRARFVAQAEAARRRHHTETAAARGRDNNAQAAGQGNGGSSGALQAPEGGAGQTGDQNARPDQDEIPDIGIFPPGQEPPDL